MDPMSMYAGSGMYPGMYSGSLADMYGGGGKMKSSVHTDSDSTSSSAGVNFNDYDDENGNYYSRKSAAARRSKYATTRQGHPGAPSYYDSSAISRAGDDYTLEEPEDVELGREDDSDDSNHEIQRASNLARESFGVDNDADQMLLPTQDEEKFTDDDSNHQGTNHGIGSGNAHHRRTKRQIYYQSGYNGHERCRGFPLEINVRSRIKPDQMFPIHGNSQIKKCIPVG